MCKSVQHEPDGPMEMNLFQRTNAPRVSYVNPSRSQLEAVRRPPSMTFVCFFHETIRKMNTQQAAAQTHRFTRHIVYRPKIVSHNKVCATVALSSSSSSVSAVVWSKRLRFLPLGTLGMLLSWCPGMKSTCVVISASQRSLVIAHDISIFVAAFRRGLRGVQQGKS